MAGPDAIERRDVSRYATPPNKAAAVFFAAAFAATALLHIWQCIHYKCFKLTALLPLACTLLIAGFATRTYGAVHPDDAQVYTASTLLLYMAPPIFQLVNIQILGRIFHFVPYFAPMHPTRILVTFSSLTFIVELLTTIGIAYISNTTVPEKMLNLGATLTNASLVLQVFVTAVFFILAGIFHHCCRSGFIDSPKAMRPLLTCYASMLIILMRIIYRMVEHFGTSSSAVRDEWAFYIFDATPLLVSLVVWNVMHPLRYLPESDVVYLAQDGVTLIKGPGWKDSRSFGETFFDPFAALTNSGGNHQKQFWQNNGYFLRTRRRRRRTRPATA
ncbi:RTA1 domain protein [Lasiosphaeris hirsuta]|uniref:RTA1 domain protein n=1 Tax=Lasiosphaeris hirsuta TaxID=260670 RepID=A0AA40DLU1_9PEZI|nr:RTA1 domain protein [Lasiosphaeris hirsuta]